MRDDEEALDTADSIPEWEETSESDASDLEYETTCSDDGDDTATAPALRYLWRGVRVVSTLKEARDLCELWNEYVYTYKTRYKTERKFARVYICRFHLACEHQLKIVYSLLPLVTTQYRILQAGDHTSMLLGTKRRDIHSSIRDEVDALLKMGFGPMRLRVYLSERYDTQAGVLALMPSAKQLENRKSYLTRTLYGGWDVRDYGGLCAWATEYICDTKETFMSVTTDADLAMDELVILDTFAFDVQTALPTFGVIVSSRRLFRNVATSVRDQSNHLLCATDGTYKFHFGGWTLVDCGTECVVWSSGQYVHRFIPWVYMFVRSESAASYGRMVECVKRCAKVFFDIDVVVRFGSLDHSEDIASVFECAWPRVKLLLCWPHLVRNAKKYVSLLSKKSVFDDMIKPHLNLLHEARSHDQFTRMAQIFTDQWIKMKETAYANWFRSVYLVRRWER